MNIVLAMYSFRLVCCFRNHVTIGGFMFLLEKVNDPSII